MPRTSVTAPADAQESLVALLNTLSGPEAALRPSVTEDGDPLAAGAHAAAFLRGCGIAAPRGAPDARQLRRLREIRDAADARARGRTREYERLARSLLRRYTFTLGPRGELERAGAGWDAFVIDLVLGLAELADGTLRVCRNAACRWAFVDRSNSGRRVWCDMARCGNRAKVARFRRRARARA